MQVADAFDELSEDVKQHHVAQQQQELTDKMAKVLEAVDLDKFMGGASSRMPSFFSEHLPCLAPSCSDSMWHHAGAPLKEAVRPGHELPEKVLQALKDDGKV